MTTLREDAAARLLAGATTVEEVLRVTQDERSDNGGAVHQEAGG